MFRLLASHPLYRLRHSLEGSPIPADRIEFTCPCGSGLCYGRVVLVPWLSTPCGHDAGAVRYPTALRRRERDLHRAVFPPSQAHARAEALPAGSWTEVMSLPGDGTVKTLMDANAAAGFGVYRVRVD